ncbi:Tox-REase-5 domain-containing protein [Kocuria sp.]|uniref:Tox-REase-5 domain-containing protein n=1 Tax=Kocuria sp. TaxID=1871328 RepID=UPI0026E08CC9|nr:Tox-REase-5 domain-containing protein [Kocuria sp.]
MIDSSAFLVKDGDLEPAKISMAGGILRSVGSNLSMATGTISGTWDGIQPHYQSPEQDRVYTVMQPAVDEADDTVDALQRAEGVLEGFAQELSRIIPELAAVTQEADDFRAEALAGYNEVRPTESGYGTVNPGYGTMKVYPVAETPSGIDESLVTHISWREHRPAFERNQELVDKYSGVFLRIVDAATTCAQGVKGCLRHVDAPEVAAPDITQEALADVWGSRATEIRDFSQQTKDFLFNSLADVVGLGTWNIREGEMWDFELAGQSWGGLLDVGWSSALLTVGAPSVLASWGLRQAGIELPGAAGAVTGYLADRFDTVAGVGGSFVGWDHQEYLAGGDAWHKWQDSNTRVETGWEAAAGFTGIIGAGRAVASKGARAGVRSARAGEGRAGVLTDGSLTSPLSGTGSNLRFPSLTPSRIDLTGLLLSAMGRPAVAGGVPGVSAAAPVRGGSRSASVVDPGARSTGAGGSAGVAGSATGLRHGADGGTAPEFGRRVGDNGEVLPLPGDGDSSPGSGSGASRGGPAASFADATSGGGYAQGAGAVTRPVDYNPDGRVITKPTAEQMQQALANSSRFTNDRGSFMVDPRTLAPLREVTNGASARRAWLVHQNPDGTLIAVNRGHGNGAWAPVERHGDRVLAYSPDAVTPEIRDAAWSSAPRNADGLAVDFRDGSILDPTRADTIIVRDMTTGEYFVTHKGKAWRSEDFIDVMNEYYTRDASMYTSGDVMRPGVVESMPGTQPKWNPLDRIPGVKVIRHKVEEAWMRYQAQISGLDIDQYGGLAEWHQPRPGGSHVQFDGRVMRGDPPREVFLEAKHGYKGELDPVTGRVSRDFESLWEDQLRRQLDAMPDAAHLEWHFSSPEGAAAARRLFSTNPDFSQVKFIYTPLR